MRILSLLVPALLASLAPALAQVTASISGHVEDGSGGIVSDATVTVKTVETGGVRVVATDASGNFRVLSLPLGLQEVKVEKAGFKGTVRTGLNLEVGQEAVVSLRLEVGQVSEAVTVLDDAPLVNTTTSSVSGFVGEKSVKELPLNGRSFDNLITLNPSAINYSSMKSANTSAARMTSI